MLDRAKLRHRTKGNIYLVSWKIYARPDGADNPGHDSRSDGRACGRYAAFVKRGQELAQLLCARCHAIAGPGPGTEEKSPPFSTLVSRLTLEGIADQLLEGLPLGHEPMPQWQFSEQQVEDLLFYIESVSAED